MAFVCDKSTIAGGDSGQFHLHLIVSFYLAQLWFVHFAFTISPKWFSWEFVQERATFN